MQQKVGWERGVAQVRGRAKFVRSMQALPTKGLVLCSHRTDPAYPLGVNNTCLAPSYGSTHYAPVMTLALFQSFVHILVHTQILGVHSLSL